MLPADAADAAAAYADAAAADAKQPIKYWINFTGYAKICRKKRRKVFVSNRTGLRFPDLLIMKQPIHCAHN